MGGLGTLKYAFKYPHHFAGAAAQQPAMVCGDDATVLPLEIDQMATNSEDNIETYGAATMAETDRDFFRGFISPIAMCLDNAAAIRESGVKIFLDVGDRDFLGLANAAELMHRVLWEQRIEHEYHLVHLGDHAGSSWRNRGPEAMDFLFRTMDNALDPVDPLSAEERAYAEWVAKGRPADEPQPPMSEEDMAALTKLAPFSDKMPAFTSASAPPGTRAQPTDGPTEIMGHPWRAKL